MTYCHWTKSLHSTHSAAPRPRRRRKAKKPSGAGPALLTKVLNEPIVRHRAILETSTRFTATSLGTTRDYGTLEDVLAATDALNFGRAYVLSKIRSTGRVTVHDEVGNITFTMLVD